MNSEKKKYFEDPYYNAAFERCMDVLAELIEKYADKVIDSIEEDDSNKTQEDI